MGQPRVKWADVERYFLKRPGFSIEPQGGDKIVKGPALGHPPGKNAAVRIGHHYCGHAGDELGRGHVSALKRAFGVTVKSLTGK